METISRLVGSGIMGATADVGAVTWGDGTLATSGTVSSSNSLVGSSLNDNIGNALIPLN
jgi:hypothetical protein